MYTLEKPHKIHSYKVVVFGDPNTNKTEFIAAYVYPNVPVDQFMKSGSYVKNLTVGSDNCEVVVFDTSGEEEYDRLRPLSYQNANGIVLLYKIDNLMSFTNAAEKWFPEIRKFCPSIPVVLVGLHGKEREVPLEMGENLKNKYEATCLLECNMNQIDVRDAFDALIRAIYYQKKEQSTGIVGFFKKLIAPKPEKKLNFPTQEPARTTQQVDNNPIKVGLPPSTIDTTIALANSAPLTKVATIEFDLGQLEIHEKTSLGTGSFGQVFYGTYFQKPAAIKVVKNAHLTKDFWQDFNKEIDILLSLKHKNIVELLACSRDKQNPMIILEYMELGSLYTWIHNRDDPIDLSTILQLSKDICLGMNYLHSRHPMIIHRDLKSLNILLNSQLTAKICDFGMSKSREHTSYNNTQINALGTYGWTAPEYLTVRRITERTEKGDVFSFGVVLWELVTMEIPWKREKYTIEDIKESVIEKERLKIPSQCDKKLKTVIEWCWNHDPTLRPSFAELVTFFEERFSTEDDDITLSMQAELVRVRNELKIKKEQLEIDS